MWIELTPEVRSYVRERGGLLFVRARRFGSVLGGLTLLETSTDPPPDALEWRRIVVRDMRASPQLHDALRISIGSAEENDVLLRALSDLAKRAQGRP